MDVYLVQKHPTLKGSINFQRRVLKRGDAEIWKIGEFSETRPARNSAGLLSILCGEADRPTTVERGQLPRIIIRERRIGQITEMNMFNKEGSVGKYVAVPSASNPEMLIWVNACTEEAPTLSSDCSSQYGHSDRKSKAVRRLKA